MSYGGRIFKLGFKLNNYMSSQVAVWELWEWYIKSQGIQLWLYVNKVRRGIQEGKGGVICVRGGEDKTCALFVRRKKQDRV